MSEVLYEAGPSMIRMNPLGTLLAIAILVLGIGLAVANGPVAAMAGLPQAAGQVVGLAGILIAAFGLLRLLIWYVATKVDHLKIKDDEIVWTHGLLNKQYTEIGMGSVRTVQVSQSLLQRVMNAGDITIFTSGDAPELVVRGLPDPTAIREHIKGRSGQA